jgi:hypothetical protein
MASATEEFYSVIDGAFALMLILLTAVNEEIEAGFVGAFEDDRVAEILSLPEHVTPVGLIALGYPDEKRVKLERIQRDSLVHYEHWQLQAVLIEIERHYSSTGSVSDVATGTASFKLRFLSTFSFALVALAIATLCCRVSRFLFAVLAFVLILFLSFLL